MNMGNKLFQVLSEFDNYGIIPVIKLIDTIPL